jgi:hypothetical protein
LTVVLPFIGSPSIGLRIWALKALWALNGDRPPHFGALLAELAALRAHPVGMVRYQAMELIGPVAAGLPEDHPERPRLVAWVHEGLADHEGVVRRSGATSLGTILPPQPGSVDRLRRALSDPEDYVRFAAEQSLRKLGPLSGEPGS